MNHVRAWSWPGISTPLVLFGTALIALEAALVTGYFAVTTATPGPDLRYLVYPFVWINAAVWAIIRADPQPASRWHRRFGIGVGSGYFLTVMAIPGNIGLVPETIPFAVRVGWYVPGWGPLVAVSGPVRLYLIPFEVLGYLGLAYLVYATVLDATRGAMASVLGVATCVGCTVPVIAPFVGLLGGPATGLVTTAYAWSYDLGTVFFLGSIGMLSVAHHRRR